jgi:hypothetical protein
LNPQAAKILKLATFDLEEGISHASKLARYLFVGSVPGDDEVEVSGASRVLVQPMVIASRDEDGVTPQSIVWSHDSGMFIMEGPSEIGARSGI